MSTLACVRYGKGPNGTDKRLETADPEEADCLKKARLWCVSQVYNCISDAFGRFKRPKISCFDQPGPGCLGDLSCYNESCIPMIEKCYCTGLCGMKCIGCSPDPPTPPPPDTPGTINETDYHLQNLTTNSCWGCPIPIPFGTVLVEGNIIWIGNKGIADIEVRETVGNVTNVTKSQYGFVDFALAVGEGVVEAISRVWINDQLVVDQSIALGDADQTSFNRGYYDLGMEVYIVEGTDSQALDQRMQRNTPLGMLPAYRGLSYIMFKNFPIFTSTSSMPSIRVEIITTVDQTASMFDTITIGDAIPNYLDMDEGGKRAIVSNGLILKVVDMDTNAVVNTYEGVGAIRPTARMSPEGNMLFQVNGGQMSLVRGFDKNERVSTNVPAYDFARSIRIHDEVAQELTHVVPVVTGRNLTFYRMHGIL